MTTYTLTLTNPGGEAGTATGWTQRSGAAPTVLTGSTHSGTWRFEAGAGGSTNKWDQEVDVSAYATPIDARTAAVKFTGWHSGPGQDDTGAIYIEAYDGSHVLLDSIYNEEYTTTTYTQDLIYLVLPISTRYVRVGTIGTRFEGSGVSVFWDDFEAELSDDAGADYGTASSSVFQLGAYSLGAAEETSGEHDIRSHQLGVYSIASQPADAIYDNQSGVYVTAAAETSNTFHDIIAHQLGAYALVRGLADRRDLRAWTFTQDDHDFYVLQLGDNSTIVWDKLTGQWANWVSPDFIYWRGQDGCDWEGFNLTCDTENGKLWEIDPEGRLDYDTTSIRSQVTGQLTERFRNYLNCYMAELAISEAQPPASIDASTVGITLRTYDSNGLNSVDHGEVTGEAIGEDITVRWYGLGLMQAPGRVFEITDTGYARRVEGLNLEVGPSGSN